MHLRNNNTNNDMTIQVLYNAYYTTQYDHTLQIKLVRALGKIPLNPIRIWVKHVLPKIF